MNGTLVPVLHGTDHLSVPCYDNHQISAGRRSIHAGGLAVLDQPQFVRWTKSGSFRLSSRPQSSCRYKVARIAAAAGIAVTTLAVSPAQADDEEVRAAAALAQNQVQKTGAGFVRQVGDATYAWRPYIETETGVDTNPDNSFDPDGSTFIKVESGMKATLERAKEYYALALKGRFIDFMQLEEDQQRSDFKAAIDTRFTLNSNETVSAGSYYLHDLISLARADIFHSYMEYALRTDDYRVRFLGKNHTELNLVNDQQGTEDFDDFIVSRSKAFDYSRSDAQVNVLTFTRFMLQPFMIYDFGHIDFTNQFAGASIDRDATEHFGIAGIRFQLSRDFRVDVGYRHNFRDFGDATFTKTDNGFIDVNVFWQPSKDLRITGVIERYFDEATSSFGLVDDVKSYGMTFDWNFEPQWRLAGTVYFDDETPVGDTLHYHKLTTTMSLSYDVNDHLELFVSGLGKWVEEQVADESYQRFKIGSGARIRF